MKDRLTCASINIHTTSVCTLSCKKCVWNFPEFKKPVVANIEKTISALDKVFQLYDYIHEVRFAGAEAFLYPDLEKLMKAVGKYSSQFEYADILTNGTYLPKASIVETMKHLSYPFFVRIDDYGELSREHDALVKLLEENGIRVDDRTYTGEDQAFGGWVDLGNYEDKHYTREELLDVFRRCRTPESCIVLLNDQLTHCGYATGGWLVGKIPYNERDFIDLSRTQDVEILRTELRHWGQEPFEACKYCNGFDPVNSPRIPAAEQLTET